MQLFLHAVFAMVGFTIIQEYIHAQDSQHTETDISEFNPSKSIEEVAGYIAAFHEIRNHTFIALIDGKTHDKYIQPEISASFVVIGSKKMFEAGYEQYLPIERIVSHPKYRGWTADIALVYTFAGMMSDKPGTIMPLADEKISIPKRSNLTVFSWGRCKDSDIKMEMEDPIKDWNRFTKYPLRANTMFDSEEDVVRQLKSNKIKNSRTPKAYTKESQKPKAEKTKRNKTRKQEDRYKKSSTKENGFTDGLHRSQTLSEDYTDESSDNSGHVSEANHKLVHDSQKHYGSIFKNYRRNMGSANNEVSVENFTFVSMKTCHEMMKKSLPDKYKIKNPNEYICYSSEDHFVTDEDAGAPAIRHGQLVAVTVGGVECNDEHVAVGIKIACFCNWIAENLPEGGQRLNCCENCCDADVPLPDDDYRDETGLRSGKKKKIRL